MRRIFVTLMIVALSAVSIKVGAKESVVGFKVDPVNQGSSSEKLAPSTAKSPQSAKAEVKEHPIKPAKTESKPSPKSEPKASALTAKPEKEATAAKEGAKDVSSKELKTAGYDKGFFIQSPDGKFKLVINGYAQFHLEYEHEKGADKIGFRVRRARISFSGNIFSKKLTYKFQIDLVKFKEELLLDAYMNYKFYDALELRFGQQTVPYIRQHIESSSNQEFVDRSLASLEFINAQDVDTDKDGKPDKRTRNGRDVGLMIHGRALDKKLEYQAGVFNGSGTNSTNFNNSLLYAARTVYNIRGDFGYEEGDFDRTLEPAVFLGASGNYNVRDLTNDKVSQLGAETGLKYKGLALQGEFFFRRTRPGDTSLAKTNDFGYYAQAGYFVLPKRVEIAARASQVFLEGLQNDKAEFQVGVNGFLMGKNLKLQTDYSVLPANTKNGVETAQRWRLRLQTKF